MIFWSQGTLKSATGLATLRTTKTKGYNIEDYLLVKGTTQIGKNSLLKLNPKYLDLRYFNSSGAAMPLAREPAAQSAYTNVDV